MSCSLDCHDIHVDFLLSHSQCKSTFIPSWPTEKKRKENSHLSFRTTNGW
jgi:hypothetical protein